VSAVDLRPTRARYGALGFTLVLAAIAYLDRVCISTAAPAIKADLRLTDGQMGYVFSAFTLAYAVMEVPAGWLADRFGSRLMLARVVIWWSAFTAITGLATGFVSLFLIRLLFGMGEAGTFPGISRVFARWLPAPTRGRAFGLAVMTGALGGAITQPLVVALLGLTTWRLGFPIFGGVGLVWAAAWFWWFRDDPHRHRGVNAGELQVIGTDPPATHPPVPWRRLARSGSLAALCVMYFGAIYGWYFYLTWLPTYLLEARGFNLRAVGWLAALPLVGIAIGVFSGGLLSDLLCRRWGLRAGRRAPGLVGFPLAALAVLGALTTANPLAAAGLLALAAGLAALGVSPAWAACLDIAGRHAGTVTGAMNTFGNLGGALSPLVVGFCLDRWHSYSAPLVTVACFYGVAAAAWLGIDASRRI
jgi:MFS transporter, ACS family, glucarate transporter